jgi:hypothetical protein
LSELECDSEMMWGSDSEEAKVMRENDSEKRFWRCKTKWFRQSDSGSRNDSDVRSSCDSGSRSYSDVRSSCNSWLRSDYGEKLIMEISDYGEKRLLREADS